MFSYNTWNWKPILQLAIEYLYISDDVMFYQINILCLTIHSDTIAISCKLKHIEKTTRHLRQWFCGCEHYMRRCRCVLRKYRNRPWHKTVIHQKLYINLSNWFIIILCHYALQSRCKAECKKRNDCRNVFNTRLMFWFCKATGYSKRYIPLSGIRHCVTHYTFLFYFEIPGLILQLSNSY